MATECNQLIDAIIYLFDRLRGWHEGVVTGLTAARGVAVDEGPGASADATSEADAPVASEPAAGELAARVTRARHPPPRAPINHAPVPQQAAASGRPRRKRAARDLEWHPNVIGRGELWAVLSFYRRPSL